MQWTKYSEKKPPFDTDVVYVNPSKDNSYKEFAVYRKPARDWAAEHWEHQNGMRKSPSLNDHWLEINLPPI